MAKKGNNPTGYGPGLSPGSRSTQFKAGCRAGPGRTPIPTDERELRRHVQLMKSKASYSWSLAWGKYHDRSITELEKLINDKTLSAVELTVVRAKLLVINKPRMKDIAALHRLECGSDPRQLEVTGAGGEPLSPFSNVPTSEVQSVVEALLREEKTCRTTPTTSNSSPASASVLPSLRSVMEK